MYHPSYPYLLSLVSRFLKKKPINIVDYGCGNGVLLNLLEKNTVRSYQGYEVSDSAISVGRKQWKSKKISFHKIDTKKLPKFPKNKKKDLWIFIGALQYMGDREINTIFKEASKTLSKEGILAASCVTDHPVYQWTNLYRFFLPNRYINRKKLLLSAKKAGLVPLFAQERGLIIGPLFSHGIVIFFDALDKLIFRNKGKLGPIGIFMRKLWKPIMHLEYYVPIDYGYTLFVVFQKK